jgi:hypothetical protein
MACRPGVIRSGSNRSRADHDNVRQGSKQAHHEAVWLVESADLAAAGPAFCVERDHTVERRDEVGDNRRPVISQRHDELAAVAAGERGRHRATPNLHLPRLGREEPLKGHTHLGHRWRGSEPWHQRSNLLSPLASKNSLRRAGSLA